MEEFKVKGQGFKLEMAIASSKSVESVFNLNSKILPAPQSAIYQKSLSMINTSLSKLNQSSLNALNSDSMIARSEDFEVASSGKDTEYSVNP